MYSLTFQQFSKYAEKGNLIPLYKEIICDTETPVSAYQKIASDNSFLLESVEKGEVLGRYSFLGKGELVDLSILDRFKPVVFEDLPRFHSGIVGYFSYDYIRNIEKIPNKNPDPLNLPETNFIFAKNLLAFDHIKHKIIVISNAIIEGDIKKAYENACQEIDKLEKELSKKIQPTHISIDNKNSSSPIFKSNFTKEQYYKIVEKAKSYIKDGDIFQVVPSQRFETTLSSNPFDIYRKLRIINPSPYMFYINFGDFQLVGASPEILVRLENKIATVRPIAGTRPRGKTKEEDNKNEKELLSDKKEKAEHIMLVDLGRNDLGRICNYNSIQVTDLMTIERYSHVMHIVSNVQGKLQKGKTALQVFNACFPAGTVSGAPKIRAMEIIDELEPVRRSIYSGAVGYFDFAGNMDTCIAIRTIVIKNKKAFIQAGGGIVADSNPELEYQETINKAKAMLKAF